MMMFVISILETNLYSSKTSSFINTIDTDTHFANCKPTSGCAAITSNMQHAYSRRFSVKIKIELISLHKKCKILDRMV
jgi:hypothetical protein